ncbi:hypothetical protein [Gemmatimonas sp.]|uniref:hypothetical protein n=1 Tax=Gemmatimonas sp. TaxID=1962908 RepID=UPI0031C7E969|nr:hypothetical protein [Gemmatimonas sp.]
MLSYRPGTPARRRLRAVAFALPALVACGRSDGQRAGESSAAIVAHDATASGSSARQGTWQDGDETIEWSASTQDGKVAGITERYTFGTDGRGERTLRFDGKAALLQIDETSTQVIQYPDRTPAPSTVQITLQFSGDSVSSRRKLVDGATGTVREYEIDRLRRHARSIAEYIVTP